MHFIILQFHLRDVKAFECLHEELSQQVGHAQQDEEAVEEGRGPAEEPLPPQGHHLDQGGEDEHQGQATARSREPAQGGGVSTERLVQGQRVRLITICEVRKRFTVQQRGRSSSWVGLEDDNILI